ncbi:MAG: heavy-metal-associated domain-containing protein [Planctomycetes bacterium]|nr:heavy-metal-associated domain-containing protein [Planctomycetota bacterium]
MPLTGDVTTDSIAKLEGVEKVQFIEGFATITLKKKASLTLSALEKVVQVDREKLTFDGKVTLRLSGMTCESCVSKVREALKTEGISEICALDLKQGLIQGSFKKIAFTAVEEAIGETEYKLEDIVWTCCAPAGKPGQKGEEKKGGHCERGGTE